MNNVQFVAFMMMVYIVLLFVMISGVTVGMIFELLAIHRDRKRIRGITEQYEAEKAARAAARVLRKSNDRRAE